MIAGLATARELIDKTGCRSAKILVLIQHSMVKSQVDEPVPTRIIVLGDLINAYLL